MLVDAAELAGGGRVQPGRGGRDHPDLTTQDDGRRGRLASRGAALVVALRAEQLLESIIRARQVGKGVTVEQPRSVAAGDLAEVVDRSGQGPDAGAMAGHGGDQTVEAALDLGGVLAALIAENVGGPVHPVIGTLDVRPECGGALQAAADQLA